MIAIRKFPEGHTFLFSFRPLCLRRRDPSETLVAFETSGGKKKFESTIETNRELKTFASSRLRNRQGSRKKRIFLVFLPPYPPPVTDVVPFFAFLFRWIHPRVWKRHTPLDAREKNLERGNFESSSRERITSSMVQSSIVPSCRMLIAMLYYWHISAFTISYRIQVWDYISRQRIILSWF